MATCLSATESARTADALRQPSAYSLGSLEEAGLEQRGCVALVHRGPGTGIEDVRFASDWTA